MPSAAYFDQHTRIAAAKGVILEALHKSGERDIAIWIAVFAEMLKTVSDWNLQAERGEAQDLE